MALNALACVRAAAARIGGESARLDAELLVAHALGISREALLLGDYSIADAEAVDAVIARRVAGEPVAYMTGRQSFWSLELEVTQDVLIPRADTETLIEAALRQFSAGPPDRILDLGTGSGALMLAALNEWPASTGIATDISAAALAVARRNAVRLGVAERCLFVEAHWASGIDESFDLVLSNPPYVGEAESLGPGVREYEPAEALFAGTDGLSAYREIVPALPRLLRAGGAAIVEIGNLQADAVSDIGRGAGLAVIVHKDLAGRDRALTFHRA